MTCFWRAKALPSAETTGVEEGAGDPLAPRCNVGLGLAFSFSRGPDGSSTVAFAAARRLVKCSCTSQPCISPARIRQTHLEFPGQIIHITAVFIIRARVLPDKGDFLFKSIPTLKVCNSCRRLAPMPTDSPFLDTTQ